MTRIIVVGLYKEWGCKADSGIDHRQVRLMTEEWSCVVNSGIGLTLTSSMIGMCHTFVFLPKAAGRPTWIPRRRFIRRFGAAHLEDFMQGCTPSRWTGIAVSLRCDTFRRLERL